MTQQIIVNVVGARPNFMKVAPIHRQMLARENIRPILVHTGQHYDRQMSADFFQDLAIPEPHQYLGVGSGSHAEQTAAVMVSLEKVLQQVGPDLIVVVGDVNSTLAAALVASKLHIPIAHVEAGLRSRDRTMPEEINRILTDALSDYCFVTEQSGVEHLRQEGIEEEKIHFVGNVMIDSLIEHLEITKTIPIIEQLKLKERHYALITLHRPTNVDVRDHFAVILSALEEMEKQIPLVFPLHPRTQKMLQQFGFEARMQKMKQLHILPPLGYLAFLRLMSGAVFVLTDSGGIQEETTFLNVPCLTLRDTTERPVTIALGTNRLVLLQQEAIVAQANAALSGQIIRKSIPPLWDGRSSQRIVNILAG